jgi:hypothetical protein
VCFGVVEENCTHERLHGRIVRGKAARAAVGHRPTRDHRTGIDVAARRGRAAMPDDVAPMTPQRAIGRTNWPGVPRVAMPSAPVAAQLDRRRGNATHPTLSAPPRPCRPGAETLATIWG